MYMMLGLPTIVTPCDIYTELIKKYAFGAVINDLNGFKTLINEVKFSKKDILDLYETKLNPQIKLIKYINILNFTK